MLSPCVIGLLTVLETKKMDESVVGNALGTTSILSIMVFHSGCLLQLIKRSGSQCMGQLKKSADACNRCLRSLLNSRIVPIQSATLGFINCLVHTVDANDTMSLLADSGIMGELVRLTFEQCVLEFLFDMILPDKSYIE